MKRLENLSGQINYSKLSVKQPAKNEINVTNYQIADKIPQQYEKYHQKLKDILKISVQYSQLSHENNWKFVDSKDGITAHFKQDQTKNLIYRGQGILNENIEQLGKLVFNLQDKKHYVEALKEYYALDVINPSMYIAYIRLSSPFGTGIADRELVTITGVFKNTEKKDSIIITQYSVEYPSKKTPKGVVRAQLIFQTWILEKIDDKNTKITVVGQFDAKGIIPGFIKNQVSKNQGFSISYIKDFLEKSKKDQFPCN